MFDTEAHPIHGFYIRSTQIVQKYIALLRMWRLPLRQRIRFRTAHALRMCWGFALQLLVHKKKRTKGGEGARRDQVIIFVRV